MGFRGIFIFFGLEDDETKREEIFESARTVHPRRSFRASGFVFVRRGMRSVSKETEHARVVSMRCHCQNMHIISPSDDERALAEDRVRQSNIYPNHAACNSQQSRRQ